MEVCLRTTPVHLMGHHTSRPGSSLHAEQQETAGGVSRFSGSSGSFGEDQIQLRAYQDRDGQHVGSEGFFNGGVVGCFCPPQARKQNAASRDHVTSWDSVKHSSRCASKFRSCDQLAANHGTRASSLSKPRGFCQVLAGQEALSWIIHARISTSVLGSERVRWVQRGIYWLKGWYAFCSSGQFTGVKVNNKGKQGAWLSWKSAGLI
ncbi:hypothetical protein QBC40DRAFT_41821 [Triangularia verruculosa]|uniref:Uncharacterized protein n=1 Tax=Triangularia verruculosa TaxID=2587418 RepID=A0AAN7AME2_9PEZI|nr:hypothetical protein QBC40DRAFT_41821 [Triangularia verruculosa]